MVGRGEVMSGLRSPCRFLYFGFRREASIGPERLGSSPAPATDVKLKEVWMRCWTSWTMSRARARRAVSAVSSEERNLRSTDAYAAVVNINTNNKTGGGTKSTNRLCIDHGQCTIRAGAHKIVQLTANLSHSIIIFTRPHTRQPRKLRSH